MAAPTTGDDGRRCVGVSTEDSMTCAVHGGLMQNPRTCQTIWVLHEVLCERTRQFATYGTNDTLADGTGEPWLLPISEGEPGQVQEALRVDYEVYKETHGNPTWMHLVREEVAEAFVETDPVLLRAELLQVAALCVSWVEKIDAR